jgi:[FeFe] hydrogenase H-cluster maturation GTPase HydF
MTYRAAPKTFRLHIGIFGRRNVGKSSILNALTGQHTSIVSDIPGTTTDPVEKPMELLPLGPVLFIDTAGIDDDGVLGAQRVVSTRQVVGRTDLAVVVSDGVWTAFEAALRAEFERRKVPVVAVFNKADLTPAAADVMDRLVGCCSAVVVTSCLTKQGLAELRLALLNAAPEDFINRPSLVSDLVPPGECAVLVVPIDKEAPKGRLIMPQVQCIRDLLDHDATCVVVRERKLRTALERLNRPPVLVVTDSQAFLEVAADTPLDVPMTSFSILFARFQGDLLEMVRGAGAIDTLRAGDRVLVAEACTHHPIHDDIGTVKIPRWMTQRIGGNLLFEHRRGHDFPADLSPYKLVIHCGACMWNRRTMLSRILQCRDVGVPITNYGLAIAYSLGIFERALGPFPAALEAYGNARGGTV